MQNTWLLAIAFIPAFVFWIILKILRIKLNLARKISSTEKKHFGYHAMGLSYIHDIFTFPKKDSRYASLLRLNRIAFILFMLILACTLYIVYLYLTGRL